MTSSSKEERSSAASSGSVCRPAAPDLAHRASSSSLRARGRSRLTGAVPPRTLCRMRSSSSASSSRRRPKATTRSRSGVPTGRGVRRVGPRRRELPVGAPGRGSSSAPRAALRSTFSIRDEPLIAGHGRVVVHRGLRAVDQRADRADRDLALLAERGQHALGVRDEQRGRARRSGCRPRTAAGPGRAGTRPGAGRRRSCRCPGRPRRTSRRRRGRGSPGPARPGWRRRCPAWCGCGPGRAPPSARRRR